MGKQPVDVGSANTFLHVDEGQDMWTEGIPGLPPRQYDTVDMDIQDMFYNINNPTNSTIQKPLFYNVI
jgi:hypothetical protein